MIPIYVRAGDTFFTRSNTLLGKLIRWGETDKGEAKGSSWTNHTGVVVEDGWIGQPLDTDGNLERIGRVDLAQAVVVEALWKTRRGSLVLNGTEVRAFRPVPAYDDVELGRFRAEADSYVGDTYGWWKLFVQLGDKQIFSGRKVLGQLLFKKNRPICSFLGGFVNQMAQSGTRIGTRLAAVAAEAANLGDRVTGPELVTRSNAATFAFGVPPQACDPDGMMDYCLKNPSEWQEVKD